MRFLLIEDNSALAAAVVDRLSLDGHVVDHAGDLETAKDYAATTEYDLILLDIMLPDGDGRSFLAHHRDKKTTTPVIVLTARSEVSDRISLLDLGADDYMVKPIDFAELEARCRAVLRRRGGGARNAIVLGKLEFNPASGTLKVDGTEIQLRTRELRLFEVFINAPEMVLSKPALVDRLFSYDEQVTENAIEVYVARLRKHLTGSGVSITTVRGLGYKLVHA
ncbi:response regulator transcription factor [Meridianimarinicoccus aquatilis]|uniref:Response regulator transcription factor n=1 Tax=Meridianimarinicoccus aquatilis TaxID=2552766 RepID=A0A4R6AW59_9RHOB|nr:response regulator transcription factor [Fluviibacterium aquatile]QIE41665.1 response regulator transcription factor [Rhodobacteraceae bacterium SC52]TDL87982.1 response regulator transcription factor [Fluviibacterium aquatile]